MWLASGLSTGCDLVQVREIVYTRVHTETLDRSWRWAGVTHDPQRPTVAKARETCRPKYSVKGYGPFLGAHKAMLLRQLGLEAYCGPLLPAYFKKTVGGFRVPAEANGNRQRASPGFCPFGRGPVQVARQPKRSRQDDGLLKAFDESQLCLFQEDRKRLARSVSILTPA